MNKEEFIKLVSNHSGVAEKETEAVLNTLAELLVGLGNRIDQTFRQWIIHFHLNNKDGL